MQDISRHELLDKLAAGWKVRRKSWPEGWGKALSEKNPQNISVLDLTFNDWEGEPPQPTRKYEGCSVVFAFDKLFYDEAAFIRRTAWKDKDKRYTRCVWSISLQVEELLATDWEVWA